MKGAAIAALRRCLPIALAIWTCSAQAEAPAEHRLALDLYAFSQGDQGGDPYRTEGFSYKAFAVDTQFPLNERCALRANGALSLIDNDALAELPATIDNAFVASASPKLLVLDSGAWVDVRAGDSGWTFSPGAYYHHQDGFWSGGLDLSARRELFDGNSALLLTYSFRGAITRQHRWDRGPRAFDHQLSHKLLTSWTQYLSRSWVGSLSLELGHQDGQLGSALNYVTLSDNAGRPLHLVDEILPRRRERAQVVVRARYSPKVGSSVGLDSSGYLDDWGVRHASLQPNLELPLVNDLRLRLWYRLALQQGTGFFRRHLLSAPQQRTQDSDLGSFLMHNPGLIIVVPLPPAGARLRWVVRLSGFGFYRDDGIYGAGGNLGVEASW